MRIKETKLYQFDELDDRAKENARDWWRSGTDSFEFSADNVIEDCTRIAGLIGVDFNTRPIKLMGGGSRMAPNVYYSGFSHQGQGASFAGSYAYKRGGNKALATEAPIGDEPGHKMNNEINRIAEVLQAVQRRNFYQIQAGIDHSRRSHSFHVDIDVERADGKPFQFANDADTVIEALRDVADWIYRSLEREYEYQMSDECVDETIRANEYEFTEEGARA